MPDPTSPSLPDTHTVSGSNGTLPVAPVVLTILDGWGYCPQVQHNAIQQAETPVMDALWQACPHTLIQASGADVGLPDDQMGNSEVGHLTIGAGRIIRQELVRIGQALRAGELASNPALRSLAANLHETGGTLHLVGLCSEGGVHSHVDHLAGLLTWAQQQTLTDVAVHAITDGRDQPARGAESALTILQQAIHDAGVGTVATLCGRYWAMDRDTRWDRTEKAYRLMRDPSLGSGESPHEALARSYADGVGDEFIEPIRLQPGHLKDGDAVICFNFRPDRMRQLVRALVSEEFHGFDRGQRPELQVLTFTHYERSLPVLVAFPPESLDGLLGQVVSSAGLRQYRTAETEKYPHVTYFMNGGIEKPFIGEERCLVPSPRVATYDQAPAMSANQLTESCIAAIEKGVYALVVINYANPDMVGHTGQMEATTEAIATVDQCLGRLLEATNRMGGTMVITADHGNAEVMQGETGQPWTAHTTNPVPLILVEGERRKLAGYGNQIVLRDGGGLADIAPTVLQVLALAQPDTMTGQSLVEPMRLPQRQRAPQPV